MKKPIIKLLYLMPGIFFALAACAGAAPTATLESASITPVPVTNTAEPQPTEIIANPSPSETVSSSMPALDIGSAMIGKDGMTLLYVPAGEFAMGSENFDDTKPIHRVALDSFWIDQTEVTNEQYAQCVSDKSCVLPSNLKSPMRSSYFGNPEFDNYPVIFVDWYMAEAYCEWAGRRLPTEAEWEKAARGTDGRIYPWGNNPPNDTLLNYNSPNRDTTEIGKYPDGQGPYGAYDMAGNVWEWVHDWYDYNYYQNSPSSNPLGPDAGEPANPIRGLRGGSWYYEEGSPRSIFRYGVIPVDLLVRSDLRSWLLPKYADTSIYGKPPLGLGTVGFRCAMSAAP